MEHRKGKALPTRVNCHYNQHLERVSFMCHDLFIACLYLWCRSLVIATKSTATTSRIKTKCECETLVAVWHKIQMTPLLAKREIFAPQIVFRVITILYSEFIPIFRI